MVYHNNIDRHDSVVVSPAPFVYGSTLQIGDVTLPAGGFLALKVYVNQNNLMPYRFHSIQPDGKVIICDRTGSLVGYWQTYDSTEADSSYVSSVLLDMQGALMGHIACTVAVMDLIRRVVVSNTETVFLAPNAFEFLPQCHIAMLEGYAKSFGIQSQNNEIEYHTGNLILNMTNAADSCVWMGGYMIGEGETAITVTDDRDIPVNLTNTQETLEDLADSNGICYVQANTEQVLPIAGKSLVVKAALMSNLRVLMVDNKLVLRGVLNA